MAVPSDKGETVSTGCS